MRSLARWGSLPLLAMPLGSWALSLGEIETNSYLNQPLNAEIPLTATAEELQGLRVSLAPVEVFTRAGLEYPAVLSSLRFNVTTDASGDNVIRVTSTESVSELILDLWVQVESRQGTSRRLYTLFIDPPIFLPDEVAAAPIAAPATRTAAPQTSAGSIDRPAPAPAPSAPAPAAAGTTAPAPSAAPSVDGDYTVQAGDTLWGIAERARAAGVSTNQAMISIYEANRAAFNGNINALRRGSILRIPPAGQMGGMTAAAATAEVQRQIAQWQSGVEPEPRLTLMPPSEEPGADSAVFNAANAAEIGALEGELESLQSELNATRAELAEAQRLLELQSADLANVQSLAAEEAAAEAAAAEAAAADAESAAEEAAAEAVTDVEADPVFADEATAVEADAAEEAAAEETEAPQEAAPAVAASAEEPGESLVDTIIGALTGLPAMIGAGVVAVILGLLFLLRRRGGDDEDETGQWEALESEIEESEDREATARIRAAQMSEPDMLVDEGPSADAPAFDATTEIDPPGLMGGTAEIEALTPVAEDTSATVEEAGIDLTGLPGAPEETTFGDQTMSSQTVINLDQADPIAEADFHMAYGLYDQAADLLLKALESDPGDAPIRLKLLEVYFVWGNKDVFLERARAFRNDIGNGPNADWDKVVIMGKQICPDEPLFVDENAAAPEVDLDLAGSADDSSVGLDFAFDEDDDDDLDLDLGILGDDDSESPSLVASGASEATVEVPAGDDEMLDIGERTQAGLEQALLEDVDSEGEQTLPGDSIDDLEVTQESPTIESAAAVGNDLELTLESTVEAEGPDAPTVETPTIESPAAGMPEEGDTVEQPRPTGQAESGTAEMTAEIELDDLGLDISDLEGMAEGIGDEQDDEIVLADDDDESAFTQSVRAPDIADVLGASTDDEPDDSADEDLLTATGVTQVLHEDSFDLDATGKSAMLADDQATMLAPGLGDDIDPTQTSTEVLEQPVGNFDPEPPASDDDLDLNLDDFSSALQGGDTVEQPLSSGFSGVDLDIGSNPASADDPTATEQLGPLDPQTMTEVGTKLDLARAYIDMGDPEGAKSILEEVLNEGDSGQKSEAQALIDALPA